MLRLAADENLNGDIVRGLLRRNPQVDIVRVQDVGLSSARTIGAMNGSLWSTELALSDLDAWIRRRFAWPQGR